MFESDNETSDNEESYSELVSKTKHLNFNTTKVDNNYYDEEIEISDTESSKSNNYYHGDSPPTHPISDSEEEYDHSDDEDAHVTLHSTDDINNYSGKYNQKNILSQMNDENYTKSI